MVVIEKFPEGDVVKNKATLIFGVILLAGGFPPIVNFLMTFGSAETENDWIGFFGSYTGALIGAVVAVIVSRIQAKGAREDFEKQMEIQAQQVKEQMENEINALKLSNRVFIDYTMDVQQLLLSGRDEDENKILLPRDFNNFIRHNPNDYLEDQEVSFIKLQYYGSAECVLDMKIKMKRSSLENHPDEQWDYMYLTGWRKDHNVFIPVSKSNREEARALLMLEIEYTTLLQETLRFTSDLVNKAEKCVLIKNGVEQVIYERELHNEYYILPGNRSSKN